MYQMCFKIHAETQHTQFTDVRWKKRMDSSLVLPCVNGRSMESQWKERMDSTVTCTLMHNTRFLRGAKKQIQNPKTGLKMAYLHAEIAQNGGFKKGTLKWQILMRYPVLC